MVDHKAAAERLAAIFRPCSKCGNEAEVRPYKSGNTQCQSCRSAYQKAYRQRPSTKEAKRIRMRDARESGRYRESDRRHIQKYQSMYPEKVRAQRRLRDWVKRGKIARPKECQACGYQPPPAYGGRSGIHGHHHEGYGRPLSVQWLCTSCHIRAHSESARAVREGRARPKEE